jgi:hypothetical protein
MTTLRKYKAKTGRKREDAVVVSIRTSPEIHAKLRELATMLHTSQAAIIEACLQSPMTLQKLELRGEVSSAS